MSRRRDTKTYWLTDRQSQCDFDFDWQFSWKSSVVRSRECPVEDKDLWNNVTSWIKVHYKCDHQIQNPFCNPCKLLISDNIIWVLKKEDRKMRTGLIWLSIWICGAVVKSVMTFSISSNPWNSLSSCANVGFSIKTQLRWSQPITVAARSKAWTVFARSNTGIVGSNRTRGMDICVRLFCVHVVLCVGSGLATGWSPIQGVLPTLSRMKRL
jgi:hypothetical protein